MLGVSGGVAAFKAVALASELKQRGHSVQCVLTKNAKRFVSALSFEAVSHLPVYVDTFESAVAIGHIKIARMADLVLLAPATANLLAKYAHGIADDLLTTVLLATTAPVVAFPAMNVEMWHHPATRANLDVLRERGVEVVDPAAGALACGEFGEGRLPDVPDILAVIADFLARQSQLKDLKVLISAGGTREPIDPVRFLGNRSSGKTGWELAKEAARRGAQVTLISTVEHPPASRITVRRVATASQMKDMVLSELPNADMLVMAAAVADWCPAAASPHKLKKQSGPPMILLEATVDVLLEAARQRNPGQILIGFAAETENLAANAREKLIAKGVDLVVANEVPVAMEGEESAVTVVGPEGTIAEFSRQPKSRLAFALWDLFVAHFKDKLTAGRH